MEKLTKKKTLNDEMKVIGTTIIGGIAGGAVSSAIAIANLGTTDKTFAVAGGVALLSAVLAFNVATKIKDGKQKGQVKEELAQ